MKYTISQIATLHSGLFATPEPEGEVYYVQSRHFNRDLQFEPSVKPNLPYHSKLDKHLLKKGDVLVAAKGSERFAVAYQGLIQPAVASSTFIVLRINDQSQLLPDFLAWYINHPSTQAILADRAKGTSLLSVNKTDIGELVIPMPPVKQQESILKIQSLRKLEVRLQQQMDDLREQYIQQLILHTLK
jgi:restriction endonuclease S subunit